MRTSRKIKTIILWLILTVSFLIFWILRFSPQVVPRNELIQVSGTFKIAPKYESGTNGSAGAIFTLNEYDKLVFGIPGGLYEVLDVDIFKEVKPGDSSFFLIENRIYQKKVKYNTQGNFISNFPDGEHINFYDLTVNGKNYISLDSFNQKVEKNNLLKNAICGILFLLCLVNVYLSIKSGK